MENKLDAVKDLLMFFVQNYKSASVEEYATLKELENNLEEAFSAENG